MASPKKKLTIDTERLARLQDDQASAVTGGAAQADSTKVGVELVASDSCCNKSCN